MGAHPAKDASGERQRSPRPVDHGRRAKFFIGTTFIAVGLGAGSIYLSEHPEFTKEVLDNGAGLGRVNPCDNPYFQQFDDRKSLAVLKGTPKDPYEYFEIGAIKGEKVGKEQTQGLFIGVQWKGQSEFPLPEGAAIVLHPVESGSKKSTILGSLTLPIAEKPGPGAVDMAANTFYFDSRLDVYAAIGETFFDPTGKAKPPKGFKELEGASHNPDGSRVKERRFFKPFQTPGSEMVFNWKKKTLEAGVVMKTMVSETPKTDRICGPSTLS